MSKGALSQHWLGMSLLSIVNRSIVFLYSSHVCVESDGDCKCKDVMKDPAHYETAWQLSKKRFARAQRSLGRRIGWKENIAKRLPVIHIIPGKVYLWKLSLIQEISTYSTPSVEISTCSGFSVRDRSWQQIAFKLRSIGVQMAFATVHSKHVHVNIRSRPFLYV